MLNCGRGEVVYFINANGFFIAQRESGIGKFVESFVLDAKLENELYPVLNELSQMIDDIQYVIAQIRLYDSGLIDEELSPTLNEANDKIMEVL